MAKLWPKNVCPYMGVHSGPPLAEGGGRRFGVLGIKGGDLSFLKLRGGHVSPHNQKIKGGEQNSKIPSYVSQK